MPASPHIALSLADDGPLLAHPNQMSRTTSLFRLAPRVSRSLPIEYFVLANLRFLGPVIGRLAGAPIHATVVDQSGACYRYAGLARRDPDGRFDVDALRRDEWIVQPGLIYAAEEDARRRA